MWKNIYYYTQKCHTEQEKIYIEREIQSEDHFCALDLLNCSPWKILLARQQSALCNVTCHWAFKFIKMFSSYLLLLQLTKSRRRHLARFVVGMRENCVWTDARSAAAIKSRHAKVTGDMTVKIKNLEKRLRKYKVEQKLAAKTEKSSICKFNWN